MRRTTTLLLFTATLAALSLAGCSKCKGKDSASKKRGPEPTRSQAAPPETPRIDDQRATEIAGIQVPGFKQVKGKTVRGAAIPSYEAETANAHGRKVWVMVNVQKCVRCEPIDVDRWRANPGLKQMMAPIHAENPDLVFEVEPLTVGEVTAAAIYRQSYVAIEGKPPAMEHGLQVHYNNGINQLSLEVMGGGMVKSAEEMATTLTKPEMMAAARQFLEVFAPTLK